MDEAMSTWSRRIMTDVSCAKEVARECESTLSSGAYTIDVDNDVKAFALKYMMPHFEHPRTLSCFGTLAPSLYWDAFVRCPTLFLLKRLSMTQRRALEVATVFWARVRHECTSDQDLCATYALVIRALCRTPMLYDLLPCDEAWPERKVLTLFRQAHCLGQVDSALYCDMIDQLNGYGPWLWDVVDKVACRLTLLNTMPSKHLKMACLLWPDRLQVSFAAM